MTRSSTPTAVSVAISFSGLLLIGCAAQEPDPAQPSSLPVSAATPPSETATTQSSPQPAPLPEPTAVEDPAPTAEPALPAEDPPPNPSEEPARPPQWKIVTWAPNTAEWNERLGVGHIELGCSVEPSTCSALLSSTADKQGIAEWTLSMSIDPRKAPQWALEYSNASLLEKRMLSLSFDDFFLGYARWLADQDVDAADVLRQVLKNTKTANPSLRFGITMYEDELNEPELFQIPGELRAQIDRVTLYVRKRTNERNFESYVNATEALFPNAEIWAGSYAYDRIDYWSCYEAPERKCTADEQRDLFVEGLDIQARLLSTGRVSAIEFYAATFGTEDRWAPWNNPVICVPERRTECIENTRELHNLAAEVLDRYRPAAE